MNEDEKAVIALRVQLGVTNIRLSCQRGTIGRVTGYKVNKFGEIVLLGENSDGLNWQSVRPERVS